MLATMARPKRVFTLVDRREYEVPELDACDDPCHRRIVGVTPLMTRHIKKWLSSLKPRERGQFDTDDVLQIAWETLLAKDRYYNPEKGKYTTFAIMILSHVLADLRNHCHVVDSPRDTAAKLNAGEEQSPETLERIRQSIRDVTTLEDDLLGRGDDPTADDVAKGYQMRAYLEHVGEVVRKLGSQSQIMVLTWTYGLFGHAPLDVSEQAERLGTTVAQVVQARVDAERRLGELLRANSYT